MICKDNFIDEKSYEIYECLRLLNETKDLLYLLQALKKSEIEPDYAYSQAIEIESLINEGKQLILYGIGKDCKSYIALENSRKNTVGYLHIPFLGDVQWYAVGDKYPENFKEMVLGHEVYGLEECVALGNGTIFYIASTDYFSQIRQELIEAGVGEERIKQYIYPKTICYEDKQYFDDFLEIKDEDVVVDGGCFRCDTIERFILWNNSRKNYKKIVSFEPDKYNYQLCRKIIEEKEWKKVELIHAGLSDHEDVMHMISNGDDTSYLCEEGTEETRICCIDDVLKGEKVSFIKLDVEGYELETLKGAEGIIKENHPRMAISAYHKENDLIDIPEYLLSISNDYKFMIRIYSNAYLEIVLYAI